MAATVSAAEVGRLRRDPAVARIIPDPKVAVAPAAPAPERLVKKVAVPRRTGAQTCPFNPAGPARPLQEPEADTDIRASDGNPASPGMGNSIATGTGVVVANEGMNELAGNPNFTRPDGSHVVIDAPSYTANDSNDEFYGDASSIAAQGTVNYQYSGALPLSGISPGCEFYIKGDAPGASLVDLSDTAFDPERPDAGPGGLGHRQRGRRRARRRHLGVLRRPVHPRHRRRRSSSTRRTTPRWPRA